MIKVNKPIASIILVIVIALLAFLFAWPKYTEFGDIKIKLAKKLAEYNGESAYYEKVAQIIKDIESRKETLDKVDSSLPASPAVAPIIYFFQNKGAETGLLIRSITYANAPPAAAVAGQTAKSAVSEKKVQNIMFSIDLVGNYQGLKNFLFSLESSSRLFEVESLALAPAQSLQSKNQPQDKLQTYNFKMQIKTHTY